MIRTLIADDNLDFTKGFINQIIAKFEDIKIDYISTNGTETLDIISNNSLDLVFLDLNMPDFNGLEILKTLEKNRDFNNIKIPHVIIVSGEISFIDSMHKFFSQYNVSAAIQKSESADIIYKKILEVISEIKYKLNFFDVKSIVIKELTKMGYNLKYKGSIYLIESIMYIYQNNNYYLLDNLENNVYKFIGYKYSKSIWNIKTNIIKATNLINNKEYDFNTKPTPKYVISIILNRILNKFD